nr:CHAT domain-containing protein [Glycomyces mayteni]
MRARSLADADTAAGLLEALIAQGPLQDEARAHSELANARFTRYRIGGDSADLDRAVDASRHAVATTPPGTPMLAVRMSSLVNALRTRHHIAGDPADLTEAVALARQSVDLLADGQPEAGVVLGNAANALRAVFGETGEPSDLEAAVTAGGAAVDALGEFDFRRADALMDYSMTLRESAEATGDLDRADAAVAAARLAAEAPTGGATSEPARLTHLATALRTRFTLNADARDLDEAVRAAEAAVALTPPSEPRRAAALDELTAVSLVRHHRFGDPDALAAAIDLGRESVSLTSPGHKEFPGRLTVLANAHFVRFQDSGDETDLHAAVALMERAVAAAPGRERAAAIFRLDLAELVHRRHLALGDPGDLDRAEHLVREALDLTPEWSAARGNMLWLLGRVLAERDDDLAAAETFAAAAADTAGPPALRIRAADAAARLLMHQDDPQAALPLLRTAVGLLPRLAWHGLSEADRRHLLEQEAAILAMDAAACALATGDPAEAVRLLEQGRGVRWGQLLDRRSDPTGLQAAHPGLAAELDHCLTALRGPEADRLLEPDRAHRASYDAARRLDALLERIRALPASPALPHPAEFMAAPALERLLPPPGTGPVVVLNASRWRCDALIAADTGVTSLPLPFTHAELTEQTNRYLTALQRNRGPRRDPELEIQANTVLEWLWSHVAAPVLDHLGFAPGPGPLPRIWWSPTGPLTLLPIHAAGHHHTDDGRTVLGRAVSSYTPTLRALAHARTQTPPGRTGPALLVSIPNTPGGFATLPGVDRERRQLTGLLGGDVAALHDADATRTAMIEALGAHAVVHLSTHGVQDLADPAAGGLVPYDWQTAGRIRADDVADLPARPRSLAFLSACQTATGGAVHLEEAVNVAAAMLHAGWPHVVGTLWTVFDGAAAAIAEHFYTQVIEDGRIDPARSARALHEAVRALRAEEPRDAAYWARFIHLGP